MNVMTYIRNSFLKILYFICILFTINLILLSSNPIDAQFTDIAYMDFLLLFISLIFVFIDYRRWKYNYKGIWEAINKEDNIDASLPSSSYSFEVLLMNDIVNLKNVEMEEKVREVKSDLDEMNDYITKWIHEIKIPVSVCELLSDKIEEIDVSEQLILEFNRIKFLINQVLYTSRASSYSEDLQISEVNIEKDRKSVV